MAKLDRLIQILAILSLCILPILLVVIRMDRNHEREEYRQNLLEIVESDCQTSDSYVARGLANRELRRDRDAISDFSEAINLSPSNIEAYKYRFLTYAILGEGKKSTSDFTKMRSLTKKTGSGSSVNIN